MSQNFILGLDLGQSQDYTALAILEQLEQEQAATVEGSRAAKKIYHYHIRRLERTRGTPYPQIVARIKEIMSKLEGVSLVIDQTGVGAPVVDMFNQAALKPIGVLIHGGDRVTHEGSTWRVPKRDLVGVLQVLLQNQRLKVAPGPLSDTLAKEMLNFKVKIDPLTAHDSYSTWREAEHDDLVLAVALACWYGENIKNPKKMTFSYRAPVVGGNLFDDIWNWRPR
jgi:hypothetical protein